MLPLVLLALAQPAPTADWAETEAPVLSGHVQLTFRDRYTRAGEAYFSPNGGWIIFQAIESPREGAEPDPFYAMFVARLLRDDAGRITGIDEPIRVSPPGSANTCGWFDPARPGMVLFGSTLGRPADDQKSGFQVGTRRYVWMFPAEMEIVQRAVVPMLGLPVEGGTATSTGQAMGLLREQIAQLRARVDQSSALPGGFNPRAVELKSRLEMLNLDLAHLEELAPHESAATPVFTRPNYDAECSYSEDGRFILYAHVEDGKEGERPDANIYIYDTLSAKHYPIVVAPGYDGGPFFSPDGKRITYRSDRKGNDLLQIFVADLKFENGVPVGISREYQVTDNTHVNWAPYFHPSGRYLVYGSSEAGHDNYEVFAVELDQERMDKAAATAATGSIVVPGLRTVRITHAPGADVLPVFSADGSVMMWTSQRGPKAPGEARSSSQLWIANVAGDPFAASPE